MDILKISGVVMPSPGDLTITRQKIRSSNTGRCADGEMHGDVVAKKYTIKAVFPTLSDEQAAILSQATAADYFDVEFQDPDTGEMVTKKMYSDELPFPVYSYVKGYPRYKGVGITIIEK